MRRITIAIDEKFLNGDLEELIAHLTTLKDQIQHEYGVKAEIETSAYDSWGTSIIDCEVVFYREETELEIQAQLDGERIAKRKLAEKELQTLQKLTKKYANFNGDF